MLEIIVILLLIFLHGMFALMEIAFVSAKKVRLEEKYNSGSKSAGLALQMLETPENLLSAVQVGITVLSIITGVIGGASLADHFAPLLRMVPLFAPYATMISFLVVVFGISFVAIVLGDLVPKIIAFNSPEVIAVRMAPFMKLLMTISRPLVRLLGSSTRYIVNKIGIDESKNLPVTEEELKRLIDIGSEHGVLRGRQSEILHSILRFNDVSAGLLMTPREQVLWIDIDESRQSIYSKIIRHDRTRYPVCQGSVDNVVGIISGKEFLNYYHTRTDFRLEEILFDPLIIPADMPALRLLDRFRQTRSYMAIVLDEDNTNIGVITLHDLIVHIVGELPDYFETPEDRIYKREDGSFLVDAGLTFQELKLFIPVTLYHDKLTTLGGYISARIKRIPRVGDKVAEQGFLFEIVDMDGVKVDKILIRELD